MDGARQASPRRSVERLESLDPRRTAILLLILAMAGAAALILWLERDTTYMSDEWAWINFAGGGSVEDMFRPFNQHLSVLVLLLTKLSLSLWGTALVPFKLIEVAGVLACGALVYAFSLPRVGPLVALAPAMVPMFLGTGTVILLQPLIGLQVLYSIAFGIGALVALDRGSRGGDIAACLLIALSLASFSIGVSFLAGVAVAVLLAPGRVRRAYVFLIPAILYGAWRLWAQQFGSSGGPELANAPAIPFYYADSIGAAVAALFGRSGMLGPGPGTALFVDGITLEFAAAAFVLIAIEVVVIVILVRRLARLGPATAMLWATLAVLLTLWTIQALVLVDGRTPGETRYIYPSAIAMSLVVVEAVRRVRLSRLAVGIVLGLTVIGIAANLPRFNDGRNLIEYLAPRNLAYTGLMDLAGKNADPFFNPAVHTPLASPAGALSISVSGYQEIAKRYGALGYSPARIAEQSEDIRHGSDEVMIEMLRLKLAPATGRQRGGCSVTGLREGADRIELPSGGAILRASVATPLFLRRFATEERVQIGRLEANQPALLRIPADRASAPWVLETPGQVGMTLCPAGASA